jgi:excisionase family DNA binding protein
MEKLMHPTNMRDIELTGRLWSVGDAAEALNVTTKTVYRHIQDHTLGAVRVGPRLLRIPHVELVAFLQKIAKKKVG